MSCQNSQPNPNETQSAMTVPLSWGWTPRACLRAQDAAQIARADPTTELPEPALQALTGRLLSHGGKEVCIPLNEEDGMLLAKRGALIPNDKVKRKRGKDSQCHANSAYLWSQNPDKYRIATGYALSDDGIWRQHTWLVHINGTIIETTVPRLLYFGVVYSSTESERFTEDNW